MPLIPECPVSLEVLIEAVTSSGRLHHLSLCSLHDDHSRFQASFKRHNTHGYKIHVADTALEAIFRVLGPDYGHPWSEILGEEYAVDPADDDDDNTDDFGDIL